MKEFRIIFMDGYDEVRDLDTHETIFSTKLDNDLISYLNRDTMDENVIDNVVNIWNKTGRATDNLWSGGNVDNYLLDEGNCTMDEMEIIVESLFQHSINFKNNKS